MRWAWGASPHAPAPPVARGAVARLWQQGGRVGFRGRQVAAGHEPVCQCCVPGAPLLPAALTKASASDRSGLRNSRRPLFARAAKSPRENTSPRNRRTPTGPRRSPAGRLPLVVALAEQQRIVVVVAVVGDAARLQRRTPDGTAVVPIRPPAGRSPSRSSGWARASSPRVPRLRTGSACAARRTLSRDRRHGRGAGPPPGGQHRAAAATSATNCAPPHATRCPGAASAAA